MEDEAPPTAAVATKNAGDAVRYRVLQNPISAPDQDYVADALVLEDHALGMLTLVVTPKRSDPFQIGPVPHIIDADPSTSHFYYWEEISE
ncbi:hypothetical protein WSK_3782 [Novosphingobium sp. Rr 2-17]|uniref:hypothetical protein n=1 Tax=Novosphingobium sp. Rr 2-17 TaxID=555793 RepID=UPI000269859F|nr:hypothetical protein [Novosphingobium sp. Rr 2-17]EIZ77771.1 hypothetical protein WSK_3782 [Novosphingobium sp. Rr 2-17]